MLAWPHNRRSRHKRALRVPFMTRSSSRTTGPTDTQSAFPLNGGISREKYPHSRLRSFRRSQHFSPYGKDHLHPPATSARAAGHTQSDSTVERDKPRANGVRVSGVWKRKATRNGRPGRQPEAGLPRRQRVEPSDARSSISDLERGLLVLPGGGMDLGRAGTILAPVRIEGVPPSLIQPRFVLVSYHGCAAKTLIWRGVF